MIEDPSERAAVEAAATPLQYVTFSLAGELFAVPMAPVQEIIRVPAVARLPLAPPALDGLANLRGRVLPIVDLRRILGLAAKPHDDATRALVIEVGQPLGFVVDHVASVVSVEPGQIEPASAIRSVVSSEYLTGVIQRPGADGRPQLMLTLDFARLVEREFARGPGRDAGAAVGGPPSAERAAPVDEVVNDDWRLVSFTVAGQEYAVDITAVQEIVQMPPGVAALPEAPAHVLGLISLRSRLLPLVSLRALFGLPAVQADAQHRIVVLALPGGAQVGLVTDTVKEVLSVPRSQADAMPAVLAEGGQLQEFSSICRLDGGQRLVSIVDSQRLLRLPALGEAAGLVHTAQPLGAAHREPAPDAETRSDLETDLNDPARAEAASGGEDDRQVVVFRLGAEEFGVPIMSVQEIVRVPEVLTRVPRSPRFVEGVINLRGTVLQVIDQRGRLGLPAIERNDRQRIMVYTLGGRRTGFIVDSVAEVLRIPRVQVEPAPELSDEQGRLIREVAKLDADRRLVMLIDPAQLLAAGELRAMARIDTEARHTDPRTTDPRDLERPAAPAAALRAAA